MNYLRTILKEQMDISMEEYIRSEQYLQEQEKIYELEKSLLSTLNSEQKKCYLKLEEAISLSDTNFSYEAYYQGFLSLNSYF